MNRINRFIGIPIIMALLCGCKGSTEPSSSSKNGNDFLRCADAGGDGHLEKFSLPPLTLVRDGQDLKISGLSSSIVSVGLLSGIHELTPQTQKNLDFFLSQFKGAKVQAIIVTGGVGRTAEEMTKILTALAKAPIPILITPGAQESFGALKSVFKTLKQKHPQLIDLTQVRRVLVNQVNFISLPGYFNPFYLEARSQGCSYEPSELQQLVDLSLKDKANVLISATPPKGTSMNAPDLGRGNVHIGDPALTEILAEAPIKFGFFGHVFESGGNAIAKENDAALAPGIWHPSLFLQAGSADAVPVRLVNGGRTAGIAHIIDFSGHRARYKQILAR